MNLKILCLFAALFIFNGLHAAYQLIPLNPVSREEEYLPSIRPLSLLEDGSVGFQIADLHSHELTSLQAFQSQGIYAGLVTENGLYGGVTFFVKYPDSEMIYFGERESFASRYWMGSIYSVNEQGVILGGTMLNRQRDPLARSFIFDRKNGFREIGFDQGKPTFTFEGRTPREILATRMNNLGQVVGTARFEESENGELFLYDPVKGISIIKTPGNLWTDDILINDAGTIAARIETQKADAIVLINAKQKQKLFPNREIISLSAMNIHGQIVGCGRHYYGEREYEIPILFDPDKGIKYLAPPGAVGSALSINNRGQVVGHLQHYDKKKKFAFLYDPENGLQRLNDVVDPFWRKKGIKLTEALLINDRGEIVCQGQNHDFYLLIPEVTP